MEYIQSPQKIIYQDESQGHLWNRQIYYGNDFTQEEERYGVTPYGGYSNPSEYGVTRIVAGPLGGENIVFFVQW